MIDKELIADCVHCGFCLPACPTYALWGEEMDSPRGRIHLMKQASEGAPIDATFAKHLDLCLGCLACEPACPSGVRYGQLLESARPLIESGTERGLGDRLFRSLLFAVLPHLGRLRLARLLLRLHRGLGIEGLLRAAGLVGSLPGRAQALLTLAPDLRPIESVPAFTPALGDERRRVGLLTGCVQSVFFSHVNAATLRVLAAEGCAVVAPEGQGCCGALSLHAGREAEAQAFARRTIDAFEAAGVEVVVVNAAGCGSATKEFAHLLRDDPAYAERARRFASKVRDVSEFLATLEARAERHPIRLRVAYQDACHLAHAQRILKEPRDLLRAIPGLELRDLAEADTCCGSAGIYNLVEPEPARALGDRKAAHIVASGAQAVVSANPGCLLQVRAALERAGRPLPLLHLVEILDASIRGVAIETRPSYSAGTIQGKT